jgi:hypothetical protein
VVWALEVDVEEDFAGVCGVVTGVCWELDAGVCCAAAVPTRVRAAAKTIAAVNLVISNVFRMKTFSHWFGGCANLRDGES